MRRATWVAMAAATAKTSASSHPLERPRWLVVTRQDELLPESAAVLACELPGQRVEVPHPLHRNEERLIGGQTGRVQLGDLVAKMSLEFFNVAAVDRRGLGDVGPPLGDLCLHAVHRSGLAESRW